ncbi:MAG: excinuclease ABC subunit UvrC, partial [Oscillospiraceae bacterium]
YVEGELAAKDLEVFENPLEETEDEAVSALVREYYGERGDLPRQILLPCDIGDDVPLMRLFSEHGGHRVELVTPQRGAKVELIRLANTNAQEEVVRVTTREERQSKLLELLGKLLGMEKPPIRIEAYDISNTGASDIVASMTVFENAKPRKKDYRHFKIRDVTGHPDDYHSMEEVLTRRFSRYLEGDEKFGALPDLLLIDGGDTHAAVAERVLETLGLSIPIYGMVKDDRHRTRALITAGGREISISGTPALFALIGQIQEETHRFAITFHRLQRQKTMQGSVLDSIEGVGKKRRADLLKHYKSVKNIKASALAELETVVPKDVAAKIYNYFKEDSK